MTEPTVSRERALLVLSKIDEILAWEQGVSHQRDTHFVELGRYLCEVRARQHWRVEYLKSFDEFLEKRFPQSRRKAYYLMAVHERLTRIPRKQLAQIGWTKARELVRVARVQGSEFDSAPWVHKAASLPKEEFRREVELYLTGRHAEPSDLIYFKVFKAQLPVIENAIETAGLMLGGDKSRALCLEMICADFLAGAHSTEGQPDLLLLGLQRMFGFLTESQKASFRAVVIGDI